MTVPSSSANFAVLDIDSEFSVGCVVFGATASTCSGSPQKGGAGRPLRGSFYCDVSHEYTKRRTPRRKKRGRGSWRATRRQLVRVVQTCFTAAGSVAPPRGDPRRGPRGGLAAKVRPARGPIGFLLAVGHWSKSSASRNSSRQPNPRVLAAASKDPHCILSRSRPHALDLAGPEPNHYRRSEPLNRGGRGKRHHDCRPAHRGKGTARQWNSSAPPHCVEKDAPLLGHCRHWRENVRKRGRASLGLRD